MLAQLIQLGVAWSFRGGDTTWVAIALAVVALVVLAGVAAPGEHRGALDDRPVSDRCLVLDLLERDPQLVERAGEQPGDVHLRDADLLGDLATASCS